MSMEQVTLTYREVSRDFRKTDYGLENALAKYVRRRWSDKPIEYVKHEWDLGDSEAAKVVYASASKNTLRKILHHKRGGFSLFVELLADATGTTLEQFIEHQAEEARHERAKWEAREAHLRTLHDRVSQRRDDGRARD